MGLFAISDLHLALSGDKPMDIFGDNWENHDKKIKNNWIHDIKAEDTVLIAGDVSWSMKMKDGIEELSWIHSLPGRKIIVKGNHDYWWSSITKLNSIYDDMNFIQNNFFNYEDYAICGTRGWILPSDEKFSEHDEKIYKREIIRLKLSLDTAVKNGYEKFIAVVHYPPADEKLKNTQLIDIFKEYGVEKVIYGHIHGPFNFKVLDGKVDGIEYILTSCDYLDFKPIKIM